jgi:hypothetical protein
MRHKLATPQPTKYTAEKKVLEAENAKLRQALLTALQGLSEEDEGQEGGGGGEGGGGAPPPALTA